MENADNILFIEYLEDTMSAPERESFEKRLKEDPDFLDAWEEFKSIYGVLENQFSPERNAVLKSIQEADSQFKSQPAPVAQPKVIRFKPWQWGVAASILLVIGLFIYSEMDKPLYSDYAPQGEIVLTLRSDTDSISKKAETAFNAKRYAEAIPYFNTLLETSPDNSEIQYYKSIALIETDEFQKADAILKSLAEGKSVYAYQAIYLRALAKVKQKDYKEAKSILKTIPSNVPEYQKAKKLISDL